MPESKPDAATQLFHQWKAQPSASTLSPLLAELEPSIAKSLKTSGFEKDPNLHTTMQLHLAKALPRFDPSKSNIKTFATNELKRVSRLGPRHRYTIPMPEQAALDLRQLTQQQDSLSATLGRDPTVKELADATGLSLKRISTIRRYNRPVVLQERVAGSGEDTEPVTTAGMNFDDLWVEAVYDGLDGLDRKIVDWTLGWHDQPILTKTEIAQRLGLSVSAITQRSQRLATKFDEGSEFML
jgi:DNA-directed RNA polymerase specialized sigma subunit